MLTLIEKIIFAIFMVVSIALTVRGARRIVGQISSGQGNVDWSLAPKRIGAGSPNIYSSPRSIV